MLVVVVAAGMMGVAVVLGDQAVVALDQLVVEVLPFLEPLILEAVAVVAVIPVALEMLVQRVVPE